MRAIPSSKVGWAIPNVGLTIESYTGPRAQVRWLFEVAEDSSENLDGYIDNGHVLLALLGDQAVGLLQLTETGDPDEIEINILAVAPDQQRRGIGRRLIESCCAQARSKGLARVLVSTGAADIGNLRFYQRCGFRMLRIERDAFTPASGYPDVIDVDGIRLWDRVWFDLDLANDPVTIVDTISS